MCLEHPLNTKSSTTLRFLETHEVFTLDAFLESVDRYDARAGWLLNVVRDEWHPADDPLEGMRRSLGRGTFWLECRRARCASGWADDPANRRRESPQTEVRPAFEQVRPQGAEANDSIDSPQRAPIIASWCK
jgi:hypothetical protein